MQIESFETMPEAIQYIVENKLASNLATVENTLIDKGVIKVKDITIFIDPFNLLKD